MKTLVVTMISDLHGKLPATPGGDLLLIAGDIVPGGSDLDQMIWLNRVFSDWLNKQEYEQKIGIAGNHDWIFHRSPHMVPRLKWLYLQDSHVVQYGLKIW